jgi:hypothetical protein
MRRNEKTPGGEWWSWSGFRGRKKSQGNITISLKIKGKNNEPEEYLNWRVKKQITRSGWHEAIDRDS